MSTVIDFNNHESRLNALEANGGGVIAETFTSSSYYQNYILDFNRNVFILGSYSNITTVSGVEGVVIGGRYNKLTSNRVANNYQTYIFGKDFELSTPDDVYNWYGGTFIVSTNAKFTSGKQKNTIGTLISGNSTTLSNIFSYCIFSGNEIKIDDTVIFNCAIVGPNASISTTDYDNLIVGSSSQIPLYNNVIAGGKTSIIESKTVQSGTSIIASIKDNKKIEDYITTRYGLTLVGSYSTPSIWNDYRYRIYFPDSTDYPAQLYGAAQYTDSMNILDKDGNKIVDNGKLVLEEKVKQLEEEIAELKQIISSLNT